MSAEMNRQIFEFESIARVLFGPYAGKKTGAEARNLTESKNPDVIVGVGGGSSLDVSKVVARGLTNSGALEDYMGEDFDVPGVPLITIPTTAGTAAEVTPDAVVRLPDEKVKSGFANVRASVAIVDPTLTLSLPPRLTAATGLDALSHAIESALSRIATPLTHALALESIRLISANLKTAVSNGSDLEARTNMAWATLIEGFSEGNAADVEGHAIAHVRADTIRFTMVKPVPSLCLFV